MKLIVTETLVRTYDVPDHFTRYTDSADDWFCNLTDPELAAVSSHIETREVELTDDEGKPIEMKEGYDPCDWAAEGPEETPAPIPAKLYRINPQIGRAKHSVSLHDGVSTNLDGSPFWGINVLLSRAKLDAFVRGLEAKGYQPE